MIKLNIAKIFGAFSCHNCDLAGMCVDSIVLYIAKYYSYGCTHNKTLSTWLKNPVYLGFILKKQFKRKHTWRFQCSAMKSNREVFKGPRMDPNLILETNGTWSSIMLKMLEVCSYKDYMKTGKLIGKKWGNVMEHMEVNLQWNEKPFRTRLQHYKFSMVWKYWKSHMYDFLPYLRVF